MWLAKMAAAFSPLLGVQWTNGQKSQVIRWNTREFSKLGNGTIMTLVVICSSALNIRIHNRRYDARMSRIAARVHIG
ncbi:hypothetical protein BD410DRAFT_544056 [Rickenella mellea]|uniref:Uncharacterized protein n=1 Tax=Rickenella mellea TaxID=50990 RepID=A0A4Y7PT19_9AGAM|nr:hypothetical protein BD410DRAFT_544056 [Rickenella mellea]